MRHVDRSREQSDRKNEGLLHLLGEGAGKHPDKPLAIVPDSVVTYAQGYELALDIARYLVFNCKMRAGDTVLIYVPTCPEMPSIMAACQALGLRVVMRAPSLMRNHMIGDAHLVNPSVFVVKDGAGEKAIREAGFDQPIITIDSSAIFATPLTGLGEIAIREDIGPFMMPPSRAEIVLFTSGSTGNPKGVVNRMASFMYNAFYLTKGLGVTSEDVLYAPVPVFHVYGVVSMFAAIVRQASWVVLPKYSVKDSLSLIEHARATVYFCVPTTIIREFKRDRELPHDLTSLRLCMVAGDGCTPNALSDYEKRYGCTVVLSYGMTETAATLTVEDPNADQSIRLTSNGPGIEGVTLGIDEKTQEILVKSPSFMTGALTEDGLQAGKLDDEGWYHTGDAGHLDDDGRLYVTGRIKNIIVRGGINVFPSEVEKVYRDHPAIEECAVVGYPDDELGERICLFAVLGDGFDVDLKALRAFADGQLEKGSFPDKLVVLDSIPCLPNGKRDGETLKKLAL